MYRTNLTAAVAFRNCHEMKGHRIASYDICKLREHKCNSSQRMPYTHNTQTNACTCQPPYSESFSMA